MQENNPGCHYLLHSRYGPLRLGPVSLVPSCRRGKRRRRDGSCCRRLENRCKDGEHAMDVELPSSLLSFVAGSIDFCVEVLVDSAVYCQGSQGLKDAVLVN